MTTVVTLARLAPRGAELQRALAVASSEACDFDDRDPGPVPALCGPRAASVARRATSIDRAEMTTGPMNTRATVELGRRFLLCAALCPVACTDRHSRPTPEVVAAPAPTSDDAAEEKSTIAGSVGRMPFIHVRAAFVIESPDSDATTVVYLFSNPVRCLDLSFSGWDRTIANGTLVLELKLLGNAPGAFLAVTSSTLSARQAAAEWMRTSAEPPPVEVRSTGGRVTLDALVPRGPATGTFALDFGASQLTGSFKAAFCAGGHEP